MSKLINRVPPAYTDSLLPFTATEMPFCGNHGRAQTRAFRLSPTGRIPIDHHHLVIGGARDTSASNLGQGTPLEVLNTVSTKLALFQQPPSKR